MAARTSKQEDGGPEASSHKPLASADLLPALGVGERLGGPARAAALEHREREFALRACGDHFVEETVVRFARHADKGEGGGTEVESEQAPALDRSVVVVALLLGVARLWISASESPRSMAKLLDFAFEWVLPGHGAESHRHPLSKQLETCSGLGEIRVAQLLAVVVTPERFRSRQQFWSYCGQGIVMRSSSDWMQTPQGRWVRAFAREQDGFEVQRVVEHQARLGRRDGLSDRTRETESERPISKAGSLACGRPAP